MKTTRKNRHPTKTMLSNPISWKGLVSAMSTTSQFPPQGEYNSIKGHW